MSLIIRSTRVACNTSTGTQDITISGFGTPKAALFIMTRGITEATAAAGALMSVGATDGTRNWGASYSSADGNAGSNSAIGVVQTTSCVYALDSDGAADFAAAFSAWITDGVRINWTDAPGSAYLLTVVLFGGTDLSAYTGTLTGNAAIDGVTTVTGVGFKATDLLTVVGATSRVSYSLGMVHNTALDVVTQGSVQHSDRDAQATTIQVASVTATYGSGITGTGGSINAQFLFGGFGADGFTVTTKVATGGATSVIGFLALAIATYDSYVGSFTTPTSTGNDDQTGPGFTPQFLLQLTNSGEAVDTAYSDNRAGPFGVAVADADAQYSNQVASEDAVATSNTESQSDDQMAVLHDDDGAALIATTFVSFDANGWTQNFNPVSGTGKIWLVWAVEEEAGGTVQEIGLATETDTPLSPSVAKTKSTALAAESGSPLALVTAKTLEIGLTSETETVLALSVLKTRSIGLAAETETVLGFAALKTRTIGLAAEADIILALVVRKTRAIGLSSETDTPLATSTVKTRAIGLAAETDTPLAITLPGAIEIGLAAEFDTPLALTALKTRTIGLSTESDAALALNASKSITLGLAVESDTPLILAAAKAKTLGLATETDTPLAVTRLGLEIGLATESDTPLGITSAKTRSIAQANETDTPLGLTPVKTIVLGLATETDTPLALTILKVLILGLVTETDHPLGITFPEAVVVAAFGTVFRPNRIGTVNRPNRIGTVISDRQGD